MQQNINRLLHEFYKIRDMGWVKGTSKGTFNIILDFFNILLHFIKTSTC